jgi:5-methyltetrahydropteroyltriglutamate--homocysteine methyltransferase
MRIRESEMREALETFVSYASYPGEEAPVQSWFRDRLDDLGFETYEWQPDPEALAAHPSFPAVETLFLLEPSLVTSPPGDGDDERARAAIDTVAEAVDADVAVHTYWGAIEEKVYAHLMDADVEAIGFDLVTSHDESAYLAGEYGTKSGVALGLVDGQNTLVESPKTIRDRIEWFSDSSGESFETVYATSNTELFYLPVNKFEEKLAALADAAELEEVRV